MCSQLRSPLLENELGEQVRKSISTLNGSDMVRMKQLKELYLTEGTATKLGETYKKSLKTLKEDINNTANKNVGTDGQT